MAATRTGAVVCHLGTAAFEVLEALTGAGLDLNRVALAHADRNPDPGLHLELAATGAYPLRRLGEAKHWPDSMLLDCLLAVAGGGGAGAAAAGGDAQGAAPGGRTAACRGSTTCPAGSRPGCARPAATTSPAWSVEANPARLLA